MCGTRASLCLGKVAVLTLLHVTFVRGICQMQMHGSHSLLGLEVKGVAQGSAVEWVPGDPDRGLTACMHTPLEAPRGLREQWSGGPHEGHIYRAGIRSHPGPWPRRAGAVRTEVSPSSKC